MVRGGCLLPEGCMIQGVSARGVHGPGGCLVETPRRLLPRAVGILLECILVYSCDAQYL